MFKIKYKIVQKFLDSGFLFSENEFHLHSSYQAANISLLAHAIIFSMLAIINTNAVSSLYQKTNIASALVAISAILIMRTLDKKYFYKIIHLFFFLFLVLIIFAFRTSTVDFPVDGWIFIFILSVFFISGTRAAMFYFFLFFLAIFVMIFTEKSYQNIEYILNTSSPALLGFLSIYLYYFRSNTLLVKLQQSNTSLEKKIESATKARTSILEKEKKQLKYLADHDYLTGLPNMSFCTSTIEGKIQRSQHKDTYFAVMYLDLDKFKRINDVYGHNTGNTVLKKIAHSLKEGRWKDDIVARIGGDELLIVAAVKKDFSNIENILHHYRNIVEQPLEIDNTILQISVSIGVSYYPTHSRNFSDLITYADRAMRTAKMKKDIFYSIYTQNILGANHDKVLLEKEIESAFELSKFVLYFQPQIEISTNTISGIEVLLRWNHAKLGTIMPKDFLDIARNMDIMNKLEYYTIKETMRSASKLHRNTDYNERLSVNLHIKTLEEKYFIKKISDLMRETGCKGEWIEFEIVETDIITNIEEATKQFEVLKNMGITIAIDDFGVGYSSLSYLKLLKIDKIKIDKIFVRDITKCCNDSSIIKAILAIASSFKFDVVAEGVENEKQLKLLSSYGINTVQGFYYYKPMPYEKLIQELSST